MLRWGLIGAGRAGKARANAITQDGRSRLVGAVGGDPEALGITPMPSLEVLLDSVDAVAICTPDDSHEALVQAALSMGKHVVVEFPLAGSRAAGEALFELARSRSRVLHVEHIELLTSTHMVFADRLLGASVLGGHIRFTGPPRRGLLSVAHANVARLHRVVDALGRPQAVSGGTTGRVVEGTLHYGLAELSIRFELGEGLERESDIFIETDSTTVQIKGSEVLVDGVVCEHNTHGGLFSSDQEYATARILDGGASYVSDAQVLAVLGLADELSNAQS